MKAEPEFSKAVSYSFAVANNTAAVKKRYMLGLVTVAAVLVLSFFIVSGIIVKPEPTVEIQAENRWQDTLVVVTDNDYWPYAYVDSNGKLSGHDIELVTLLANRLEMNLDIRPMSWNDSLQNMRTGQADVVLTCEYNEQEASKNNLLMSVPTSPSMFTVFGKQKMDTVDELYGKRIGVMVNGNVNDYLYKLGLKEYCQEYPSNKAAFEALADDKCDYVIVRHVIGMGILKDMGTAGNGIEAFAGIGQSNMCVGISKAKPELAERIDNILIALKKDGTASRLNEKWLTTFVKPLTVFEVLERYPVLTVLVELLIVFILLILWYLHNEEKLKKQSEKLIGTLADDYEAVVQVDLDKQAVKPVRVFDDYFKHYPPLPEKVSYPDYVNGIADIVADDDRPAFTAALSLENITKQFAGKQAFFHNYRIVQDGVVTYYQMKLICTADWEKDREFLIGVNNMDELMQKQAAQEKLLNDARIAAEAASKAKSDFLFNMSHDIRTPMNAILGFGKLAAKYSTEPDKLSDCLQKLNSAGEQLLRLINDVLEVARIESGKIELDEVPTDIIGHKGEAVSMLEPLAGQKHLTFIKEYKNYKPAVLCLDFVRINQILVNIISNAIKYTPDGGTVRYTAEQYPVTDADKLGLRFTVADNGIGMSKDFVAHIFESFSRESNSTLSGVQGTGLGMVIVKKLVDIMNGKITIDSELGKGTVVTIDFVFKIAPQNEAGKDGAEGSSVDLTGMKVLLVDDNELNREIAHELLADFGIEVTEAGDGVEALDIISRAVPGQYDVVLMDIQMPVMDGYTATREIRQLADKELADIPIIAMTANAFDEDKTKAVEAGMNGHLGKPIDIGALVTVLRKYR